MKNLIFAILLIILLITLISGIKKSEVFAISQTEKQMIINQIQILLKEIVRLQGLVSILKIEREVNAGSFLVVDISDQSIISEKNSKKSYPIASITKLMNAVIVLENIDTNKNIILTTEMLEPYGYSPSLFLGLNVSVENLLKASLTQSTNDAALALTFFLGKEKFIELMNKKAKELNMDNTFFYDAYGFSPLNHSNASDLFKLLNYIYKNHPKILEITKDNNFWLPDKTGRLLKFKNVNIFYSSPEFIGGKTGYIIESKQAMASIFKINRKQIAIIVLFSNNHQNDINKIINSLRNNTAI